MNLVFLNRMEKQVEENRVKQATVAIGEQEGIWRLIWNEPDDRGHVREHVWFEGTGWNEMLSTYRMHIAEKMGDGFKPLVDDYGLAGADTLYRQKLAPVLQCYSEEHYDESLFNTLREWRKEQATKEKKAPYLVASNRLLRIVAAFVPHTAEELRQLPGWGDAKVGQYGADIVKITAAFGRDHDYPLDWVREVVSEQQFVKWVFRQKEMKFRKQLEHNQNRRLLMEMVRDGRTLTEMQDTIGLARRELLLLMEELAEEGFELDAWLKTAAEDFPAGEAEKADQLFKRLGDRYLKPVALELYDENERKDADLNELYDRLRVLRLRFRHRTRPAQRASGTQQVE